MPQRLQAGFSIQGHKPFCLKLCMTTFSPWRRTGPLPISLAAMLDWRIVPIVQRAKRPLIKRWTELATSDVATLKLWQTKFHDCNWGVATGSASGVFVVDVDGEDGQRSLEALTQRSGGALPETLSSGTARGEHLWFHYPNHAEVQCSAGRLGPGLDVRGSGGLVLIYPSIHPSGVPYRWPKKIVPIADAPEWLLNEISRASNPKQLSVPGPRWMNVYQGGRNDWLARTAGFWRRKGATAEEIDLGLLQANATRCKAPLSEDEVHRIAASIARYRIGGPDILQQAWRAVEEDSKNSRSNEQRFLTLCQQLQKLRGDQPIALPLRRIADLIKCDLSTVSGYRKDAEKAGLLMPVAPYIAGRRAATFRWSRG